MPRIASRGIAALAALVCFGVATAPRAQSTAAPVAELAGLAAVSGTVSSPVPFKAANVYFRNVDKRMQYMVYTAGGKYEAMHLLPGKYEMRVAAQGLESPATSVTLNAGRNPPQNATLKPVQDTGTLIVSMDEMFPPGPGQRYLKENCLGCHGPAMFGSRHFPATVWNNFVQLMLDNGSIPRGFASAPL
jgi:hypothetical protein